MIVSILWCIVYAVLFIIKDWMMDIVTPYQCLGCP